MPWPDFSVTTGLVISGQGSRRTAQVRENRIQLGDGYSQGAPLGINTIPRQWAVSKHLTLDDAKAVDGFLRGRDGRPFLWQAPMVDSIITPPATTPDPVQVRCTEWSFEYSKGVVARLTATFVEDFTAPQ